MEYRRLGKSGLKISSLSFGSWVTFGTQLDVSRAKELMVLAYERGVNFFDNAEVYAQGESERIMGRVLKETQWERDTFIVSSKVFWGGDRPTQLGLSKKHIIEACNAALQRLGIDYLDLYYCHRPDPETPIEETVRAMDVLIRQGKVLYWGTSEWGEPEIDEAFKLAERHHLTPPSMEQPQYNLLHRDRIEKEYATLYERYGLGTTIWSPLASGILTGKYNDGIPAGTRMTLKGYEWLRAMLDSGDGRKKIEKIKKLEKVAKNLGVTLPSLCIAWCLKNPFVSSVILGATNTRQLEDNLKALDVMPLLSSQVMHEIETIF